MLKISAKFYSLIKTNLKYSWNDLIGKETTPKQLFCFCSFISPKLFYYVSVQLIFPTLLKHSTWTFSLRPPLTYTQPSSCSAHKQQSILPPSLHPHYADGLKRSWGFFSFFFWKFKAAGGNVRNRTETFCLPSTLEIVNFALSNRVNLQFLNVKLSLNTAQSSLRK